MKVISVAGAISILNSLNQTSVRGQRLLVSCDTAPELLQVSMLAMDKLKDGLVKKVVADHDGGFKVRIDT